MKTSLRILAISIFTLAILTHLHAEKRITIVYTNSLNGYFDDCHCKENPNGGLVSRATEIKKIRKEHKNIFLFETGDFFTVDSDTILEKYLIKAYKYIGYDCVSIGDQEFSSGATGFLKYKDELPIVCNNLLLKIKDKWELSFKRFRVLKKNGIKAGLIGTISPEAFKYYPKSTIQKIKIQDQVSEIKKDIKSLKSKGMDIIILLSHSGYDQDRELAQKIKGIDLIIGGHSQSLLKTPEKINETIIVQAGSNGAHTGILELSLGKKIKIKSNTFRLPYNANTKEDKTIKKMIDEYRKEVKEQSRNIRFK